ncbi:MAG TPA: CDP-glucose 4,6-dehydratase [Candidatus Limnocylindrales bacterium]|nr:CDP-glucose 4,6-dehydratase [Candidatus Limnocylindrales bacterium]
MPSPRLPAPAFWHGRRVFLTGHTGFKGSWLGLWLAQLGAQVHGYALAPETEPCAFEALGTARHVRSTLGDVRDRDALASALRAARPEIVFHLAAQPLVLRGYREPVATFDVNLMGTVNLLEAVRTAPSVRAVVVVTTDKVYAEEPAGVPYAESDPLGGVEPYGASKACAEIAAAAYREAFLRAAHVELATARAGNVVGGGDWSADRLIPDLVTALHGGGTLALRHPGATRPWQHVLDPLCGYLALAEELLLRTGAARAWNFGPGLDSVATVGTVVAMFERAWGARLESTVVPSAHHEAPRLALDAGAARQLLGWAPRLDLAETLRWTAEWYRGFAAGFGGEDLAAEQLSRYAALLPVAA